MGGYTVYRVDNETREKVAIGSLIERRGRERVANLTGLLREAQRLFARSPSDAIGIVIDSTPEAPVMAMGMGVVFIVSRHRATEIEGN